MDPAQSVGDSGPGERVFRSNCAMCHGAYATGMMGMHPSLRGAIGRLSREGVEVAIRKGRRTQPPMPAWEGRLSDDEVSDVIASLPDGPRNFAPQSDSGGMMLRGGGRGGVATMTVVVVAAVAAILAAMLAVLIVRLVGVPERVLARRYAAGELTREEYIQRRGDLGSP